MSTCPNATAFASSWNFVYDIPPPSSKSFSSHLPDPVGYKYAQEYRHADSLGVLTAGGDRGEASNTGRAARHVQNRINLASLSPTDVPSASSPNQLSAQNRDILVKRAWDVALSPAKSMGMTFLMMYLSGGSSGIFGILIIGYALINCVRTLLSICTAFKTFEETPGMPNIILQKIAYLCISFLGLVYVLYQCTSLGLLPINSGDYIALIPEKQRIEKSFAAAA